MGEFAYDWMHVEWIYTDDAGEQHPCFWTDTMPGKGGYVGIVYLDRPDPNQDSVEVHEFVEIDRVEKIV